MNRRSFAKNLLLTFTALFAARGWAQSPPTLDECTEFLVPNINNLSGTINGNNDRSQISFDGTKVTLETYYYEIRFNLSEMNPNDVKVVSAYLDYRASRIVFKSAGLKSVIAHKWLHKGSGPQPSDRYFCDALVFKDEDVANKVAKALQAAIVAAGGKGSRFD